MSTKYEALIDASGSGVKPLKRGMLDKKLVSEKLGTIIKYLGVDYSVCVELL